MNAAALLKRVARLQTAMGQSRTCVVSGPVGGDFDAKIADEIASGRARKTDLFICVNRFTDSE